MIPPLVLTCDACGRLFIVNPADVDDDILCDDCAAAERGSVDGLAGDIFELGCVLERAYSELFAIKIIEEE